MTKSPASATTASTANAIDFKASNGKRKAGRQVKYQSDEHEEDDEKFFAMHCLFTDLHDLRTFMGKTWEDYSCGRLNLMRASILANTAFDLARRADENYFAMCPEAGPAQNLIETSTDFLGLLCGVDPFHKHQPDDWFNYRLADGAQWIYLSILILLVSFRKLIEPKQIPLVRPGFFGDYDAKSDRRAMSLRQKLTEICRKNHPLRGIARVLFIARIKTTIPSRERDDQCPKTLLSKEANLSIPMFRNTNLSRFNPHPP